LLTEDLVNEQTPGVAQYALVEARPLAIVIHCSDPRFQKAFAEFIHGELGLETGEYVPLVVSGGVASLSEPLKLPKEFKFMKERIELFLERFDTIRRIILINHEDCRHYDALKDLFGRIFLQRMSHISEKQRDDLKTVARTLLGLAAPGVGLEMYYARLSGVDLKEVVFERV
jgi:hypothetical protein